jgi:hypothetical protein
VNPLDKIESLVAEINIKWETEDNPNGTQDDTDDNDVLYDTHLYTRPSNHLIWSLLDDQDTIQRALLNNPDSHCVDVVFFDSDSDPEYILMLFKHCNGKEKGLVIGKQIIWRPSPSVTINFYS